MSTFNASINIGNIGSSLLNFSFSGCTGYNPAIVTDVYKNCNYLTGCTALTSYDNTPKSGLTSNSITLTGLTYDPSSSQMKWIHVKAVNVADGNAETATECDDSKLCQNIFISNLPTFTPTPLPATVTPLPATNTPTPLPPTNTPTPTTGDPATNTPTPLPPTNTPTPTTGDPPTVTPTPICYGCSNSTFNGSYSSSNYYDYGNYCLNLTSATNGGTITINFSTAGRPNRFTIRPSVGTTISSGWWGSDYNYAGSHSGNMAGTNDNGSISFVYDNNLTYELQVETTNANPSTLPSDSWDVTIVCGGVAATYTPTPVVTTLSGVLSGTTLSEVCAGGATTPTLYFAGASIQIGESLFLNSNLSGPVPAGYYYYPSYNTVYNVTNGSTGAVASTPVCPTATPTSTFLGWDFSTSAVIGGPLAITLVDDPVTACTNPEYVIGDGTSNTVTWNFTVYGTNITNATAIVLLSSGFRSELVLNSIFYVRQRISGTFHYRRFQLQGSPGDTNVSALPTDVSFTC